MDISKPKHNLPNLLPVIQINLYQCGHKVYVSVLVKQQSSKGYSRTLLSVSQNLAMTVFAPSHFILGPSPVTICGIGSLTVKPLSLSIFLYFQRQTSSIEQWRLSWNEQMTTKQYLLTIPFLRHWTFGLDLTLPVILLLSSLVQCIHTKCK